MDIKKHPFLRVSVIVLIVALCIGVGLKAYRESEWGKPRQSKGTQAEKTVLAFAKEHGLKLQDYPDSLVMLLERNPETEEFVLNYPLEKDKTHTVDLSAYENSETVPLFLQWDSQWGYLPYGSDVAGLTACGPLCLSMVAYYLTGDPEMAPDRVIRFAIDNGYYSYGNGSSWTLISEGGEKLGLKVTELPLVEKKITDNLELGNPIICVLGPGDFTTSGHYIVLTGCKDGKLCINDPNSRENSEKLWDYDRIEGQIRNLWVLEK